MPLHSGQAPAELAENSAGFTPLDLANALRMGSSTPVYVAGFDRRDPRIADWSRMLTSPRSLASGCWMSRSAGRPSREDAGFATPWIGVATSEDAAWPDGSSIWRQRVRRQRPAGRWPWMSELLPEPATPVMATSTPVGT